MNARRFAGFAGALLLLGSLGACAEDPGTEGPTIAVPLPSAEVSPNAEDSPAAPPTVAAPTQAPAPTLAPAPTPEPALEPAPTPSAATGSESFDPVMVRLSEECALGEWDSCDDLYYGAPVGSDFEYWGATCGGVFPDSAGGECYILGETLTQ